MEHLTVLSITTIFVILTFIFVFKSYNSEIKTSPTANNNQKTDNSNSSTDADNQIEEKTKVFIEETLSVMDGARALAEKVKTTEQQNLDMLTKIFFDIDQYRKKTKDTNELVMLLYVALYVGELSVLSGHYIEEIFDNRVYDTYKNQRPAIKIVAIAFCSYYDPKLVEILAVMIPHEAVNGKLSKDQLIAHYEKVKHNPLSYDELTSMILDGAIYYNKYGEEISWRALYS